MCPNCHSKQETSAGNRKNGKKQVTPPIRLFLQAQELKSAKEAEIEENRWLDDGGC
jgi:hypothetical protein